MAHGTTATKGQNALMQMNDYVSSFIKAVAGLRAPSTEGLAGNSALFAATPKYHNQGGCTVLWVLCKLCISRLQVRQFRCKHYLFYGLPIFTTRCDKTEKKIYIIMAIIIALHYCCVMRIFLTPHKVRYFSPRGCRGTLSRRHRHTQDKIDGLFARRSDLFKWLLCSFCSTFARLSVEHLRGFRKHFKMNAWLNRVRWFLLLLLPRGSFYVTLVQYLKYSFFFSFTKKDKMAFL